MRRKSAALIGISIALLILGGCGKESGKNGEASIKSLVSDYLNEPRYSVKIRFEIEPEENLSIPAEIVGRYRGETIAVIFGEKIISAAPRVSPTIDYILEFPPGDREMARSAMESLKNVKFTPVLSQRKELGTVETFGPIKASFMLRNTSRGECRIEDTEGMTSASFSLERKSDHLFALPDNSGFGLKEGSYSIVCDFFNKENLSVDDLQAARFSLPHYELPQYKGGLKNTNCTPGSTKSLHAHFTPNNGKLQVRYYRDNIQMESSIFKCDQVGSYTIKAIATDKKGFTAESPEIKINVIDVPEGMINPEKFEYGEEYEWPY